VGRYPQDAQDLVKRIRAASITPDAYSEPFRRTETPDGAISAT
jgi:hypothetical protein